jgi:hypothetical protein
VSRWRREIPRRLTAVTSLAPEQREKILLQLSGNFRAKEKDIGLEVEAETALVHIGGTQGRKISVDGDGLGVKHDVLKLEDPHTDGQQLILEGTSSVEHQRVVGTSRQQQPDIHAP